MYILIYIYISSKYIGLPMNLKAWLLASPAFHEVRINDLAAPPDKLDVLAYMERGEGWGRPPSWMSVASKISMNILYS